MSASSGRSARAVSRSETRSATCFRGPRSRGPSSAKRVSFPRRASEPTSVNASVRSTTCMPAPPVRKSAIRSRSATQSATWSSVSGFMPESIDKRRGVAAPPFAAMCARLLAPVDGALELGLVHLRAALDVHALGLVVELFLRPAAWAVRAGALASPAARRHVATRRARGCLGFAALSALLVDRACGDLLRALGRRAALLLAVLDVLVLPFSLVAPCFLRHRNLLDGLRYAPCVPISRGFNRGSARCENRRKVGTNRHESPRYARSGRRVDGAPHPGWGCGGEGAGVSRRAGGSGRCARSRTRRRAC